MRERAPNKLDLVREPIRIKVRKKVFDTFYAKDPQPVGLHAHVRNVDDYVQVDILKDDKEQNPSSPEAMSEIDGKYFEQGGIELAGKRLGAGWKFHVSVDIEALRNEFNQDVSGPYQIIIDTIKKHFKGNYIAFKVTNFAESEDLTDGTPPDPIYQGRTYFGAQFTFYIPENEGENCEQLRQEITKALRENKIKSGLVPATDMQLDEYTSIRNATNNNNEYESTEDRADVGFNPYNKPIPNEHSAAVKTAQEHQEEFKVQKQQAVLDAEEKYVTGIARDRKFSDEDKNKIQDAAKFFNFILYNSINYPNNTELYVDIFVRQTMNHDLEFIREVFKNSLNLPRNFNAEQVTDDQIFLNMKNEILKKRYEEKRKENFYTAVIRVIKFLPACLLILPFFALPFVIKRARNEKMKQDEKIDVQPYKVSSQYNNFKASYTEAKITKRSKLFSPADPVPLIDNSKPLINKKRKFKLNKLFSPSEGETVYLSREKASELENTEALNKASNQNKDVHSGSTKKS